MHQSETPKPTFRMVVPTYRRPDRLARFLDCVAPQLARHPEVRLVVVNDGSHDSAYEAVVANSPVRFDYLRLADNRGCGPARQAGFDGATEDYLIATDDDCRPPPLWLDRIVALAQIHPAVDVFAGRTVPVDRPQGLISREIKHVPNAVPGPVMDETMLLTAVTANAVFRRDAFERMGGYAPDLRGAADDCYVTRRIVNGGGAWMVVPELVTGHEALRSVGEMRHKFRSYGRGSAQYVVREQDWRVGALHGEPTLSAGLKQTVASARAQWGNPENLRAGLFRRAVRAALTFLGVAAYERGWREGVRAATAQYGRGLPEAPVLGERYSAFCSEIVLRRRSA